MDKEKRETKEIVVLDNGIDENALMGPESACCWFAFIPYRW